MKRGKSLNVLKYVVPMMTYSVDIVFWSERSNFDNWERASAEDRPAGTVATDSYLSAPHRYVILDTSPLAEILEPLP